ncbi:Chloroplast envelope quinone oxidoreductase-like protein [Lachnellula suecica]|uniref:Chloroplast envelope quinone oxidoreductase-like protein n=1 Tax=Lachnellula suecica TaxID=602035 RepID=A0A8T9BT33_9HELO|nr:Chloroplast envelope quinone oxidoreductase-like protein [Lachnellula suecica]
MATQKALAIVEIGKPLQLIDIPIPAPQGNELLIKLTVGGMIPLDQKLRDGEVPQLVTKFPFVPGTDIVGLVVKSGPNSPSFPVGSRIVSQFNRLGEGCLQEYTLVDPRYTALVPDSVSDEDAAVYPVNAFTSFVTLFAAEAGLGLPLPGTKDFDWEKQTLVIIGGGTNCGKFGIQLAKLAGIGTIITTASLAGEEELRGYGATHVIDRKLSDEEVEKQVRAIVGDELLHVYDTFHGDDHSLAVSLLSNTKKGRYIHLIPGKPSDAVAARKQAGWEEKQMFGHSNAFPDVLGPLFWKLLPGWLVSGEVKPPQHAIIEGLDAERVNRALDGYRDLATGKRYHVRF